MEGDTEDREFEAHMALYCLGQELKYQSTRDFLAFSRGDDLLARLVGKTLLHDKVTMLATRVDTEFRDFVALYERWGRIVDNVTMSLPHPSVWAASRFAENKILQPEDLSNAGGFSIDAAVVSPTLNTLCVNMEEDELAPLVYAQFPDNEKDGFERWAQQELSEWDNSTIVDDVFRWGTKYGRRRPAFGTSGFALYLTVSTI
ncbi:hypothetical protein LCI18_000613 [Fusarium solani-melongenae]|uniref:Uncharacterized protein n=1 Tax=Fusarium solani subsp. cucurbitae TaxID=2747967 RepID=A0ACD3YLB3_FUSSC|nr:hypothetical protein LCI18_000613 [Fusarium solani-melongenae]